MEFEDRMVETYRGVVRPHQLDHMGHMNVQWYTANFDDATWHLFSMLGMTSRYFEEEHRGMAAVEQTTNYHAELMAGDLLVCRSKATEVDRKAVKFVHHLYQAETGVLAATSALVGVHLDRQARKSCALPEFVARKFAELGWDT